MTATNDVLAPDSTGSYASIDEGEPGFDADDGPAPVSLRSAADDEAAPDTSRSASRDDYSTSQIPLDHADLQRIWIAAQRRAWRTLAIVPVDQWISSYEIARVLTTLGIHHGESISVADLRDIRLNRVGAFLEAADELVRHGRRVVFSTRPISENLATIPLARAAEGVILCVTMGASSIGSIQEVIQEIGKERFLGSLLVEDADAVPFARPAFAPRRLEARS